MSDGSKARESQFICDQIELCRKHTYGRHIVFILEMDYNQIDSDEMGGMIHRFMHDRFATPNFTILAERTKNAHGNWVTTPGMLRGPGGPHRHARHFTSFLAHGRVRFATQLGVRVPPGKTAATQEALFFEEVIRQLREYRLVPTTSEAARLVGPTRFTMSGKGAGPDDLAVSIQWLAYALSIIHASGSFCRHRGIAPQVICGASNSPSVEAQAATTEAANIIREAVDEEGRRSRERTLCVWFPSIATSRTLVAPPGARNI